MTSTEALPPVLTSPGDDPVLTRELVDVAIRLRNRFSSSTTLAEVLNVVAECRSDLDIATNASLPELVERLAAQRLLDTTPDLG